MTSYAAGPTPAQTAGPFLRIGTEWLQDPDLAEPGDPAAVELTGGLFDGDGAEIPDAFVELWQPDAGCFGRCLVTPDGTFRFRLRPEGPVDVTIFARGLLNRLVTRLRFADDPGATADEILSLVPPDRRHTLIAVPSPPGGYHWDVRLQGPDETVFLVW